jgi:SNF2 family DNA or RNA helicase
MDKFIRDPAFAEQDTVFEQMLMKKYFALYSDLGTGKTYMLLRDFITTWLLGKVDGLLVIAPVGVHKQWISEELPKATTQECVTALWPEQPPMEKTELPRIFTIYPEAFRRKPKPPKKQPDESREQWLERRRQWRKRRVNVFKVLERYLKSGRMGIVVDESQMLMNPDSSTSKRIRMLRDLSVYRRVSSGYPAPGGLHHYYAQYAFLNPGIIKISTYSDFKARYCELGGFRGKEIVGYKNEEEFYRLVAPYTYTVKLEDVVDMPERTWLMENIDLTPEQARIIRQIREEFLAELEEKTVFMPNVLQRLTRIQQATCGFLPVDVRENAEDEPDIQMRSIPENRTKALEELVNRIDGKIVVWSRFSPCIERLTKHFGDIAVKYRGGMTAEERQHNKEQFQHNKHVRLIFAQPKSAGAGFNGLQVSRYTIYWSLSHNSQDRVQTERRTWRLGQSKACVYVDMLAKGTYDFNIRRAVMHRQNVSKNILENIAKWSKNKFA